ncbi:nuclear transport factor 2 family protein [Nocardia nova]|uniref:nuclear transport factor 2 family protein n=1 Tax=Nocardia nova TaxID=37330 RepID=UPI001893902B|nr:nuclear transport factor 2 family protein [Nocardia nova]MBF6150372.1 nuclear transport factor 2 family protein [Nocardia nova]
MTEIHPNEAALRRLYESFISGDDSVYRDLVDRDIVWHEPGDTQISGDWFGADEGLRMYQRFMEISGGTYRDELIDIEANDRIEVAIVRHHLERDGEKLSYVLAQVYRIDNGKLVEYWEYPEPAFYHAWR